MFRGHWPALVTALGLTVGAFLASPPRFRVLADETELLNIALSMYDAHAFYKPAELVVKFSGMQELVDFGFGKRPLAYPFLVYCAHVLFGYHAEVNGFLVNGVCAFALFLLFYALLARHMPRVHALTGMVLLGAIPLDVLCITSGGFEIPNLTFGTLAFLAFDRFVEQRTARSAVVLITATLVASQVRYESLLLVIALLPWIPFVLPRSRWTKLGWIPSLVPPLLVPAVWQRRVMDGVGAFEMRHGGPAFSLDYVADNLKSAYRFFTADRIDFGTIALLFWLASAGLTVLGSSWARRRRRVGLRVGALATAAAFTALSHSCVLLVYYWGDLTFQPALRLGVVFMPFLVALALVPLRWVASRVPAYGRWAAVGGLGLILYYWPVAARNVAIREIVVYREFQAVTAFLHRTYPDKAVLLISDLSHLYTPFRYGAIKFERANREMERVKTWYRQRHVRDIVAVQRIELATGQATPETALVSGYDSDVLDEAPLTHGVVLRFVRIRPRGAPNG